MYEPRAGQADLHLHTRQSDGLTSAAGVLRHVEERTDLDVIAITDHDDVRAALWAREEAARRNLRVQVVPGVEVSTRQGHLIGLWVEDRPPAFRSYESTAKWIVQHGGVVLAPHPFARVTPSVSRPVLARCVEAGLISAIETWNPSPAGRGSQRGARAFADAHPVARVGASDAHWCRIVGMARTRFPGRTPQDLRSAIESRSTMAEGRFTSPRDLVLEGVPQTIWATLVLPLRRIHRYGGDLVAAGVAALV